MKNTKSANKSNRWSAEVTKNSHALDLEPKIFTWKDPKKIASSLKSSAEKSKSRKGTPYKSAISMLNFYINRGGKNLESEQKKILENAKTELKILFNK